MTQTESVVAALTNELFAQFRDEFAASPTSRLAQNAVTQITVDDVTLNRAIVTATDHTFSQRLDEWSVTNQKRSGRCWMFAGLNLLRVGTMKKLGVKSFEFSQNYPMFWDKLERANYFLEAIIETAARDVDDRTVSFLLNRPADDGGQWNMFVNLVKKHGLVPKSVMPETESSSNTMRMNSILRRKLREGAKTLREEHAAGASLSALRATKEEILAAIYRILSIHLGTPPERFTWQWTDQDKEFHREDDLTPSAFAAKYVDLPIDEYVCLVNDPRPANPYSQTYTVQYLGNVLGGDIVTYLNVDVATMKQIARRTIEDGEPVWFGCDVSKMMRRDLGIWDKDLYDYDSLYQTTFGMNKADRLLYGDTQMTHAMLFTGVDVVDGTARRWRVENSWGEEGGQKCFYTMNDNWFDEYTFEIAARKSYLPPALQAAFDRAPIVLPAWDPMGA
ncbi:MAG TPA: C1 family peptidase, partial [Chloroflexota bacterium]|nr:C1 family peptidase [Chloroflexota bacterium]